MSRKLIIMALLPFCLTTGCSSSAKTHASATSTPMVKIDEKKMEAAQNRVQTENMYRVPHKLN